MQHVIANKTLRRLAASVLFCAILVALLSYASAVLKPTRSLLRYDAGAAWDGFLKQPRNSLDVLVFGNSHAFDGVDPTVIWQSRGITSYVMAGPTQPLTVVRRYIAETFRTQKPKVVAVELSLLSYDQHNYNRAYHLVNVGYMPWGVNRLLAGFVDTPRADRTGVLVDLWAYHSRWMQLKPSDFNLAQRDPRDEFLKGFQVFAKSRPVTATVSPASQSDDVLTPAQQANVEILKQIAKLCKAHDVQLLVFLTPTGPPGAYSAALDQAGAQLTSEFDNVKVLDLSVPGAVPGLSYKKDFFDGGHLTTQGAEKDSKVLAAFLARTYGLHGHRGDAAYSGWNQDAKKHDLYVAKVWRKPAAKKQ